MLTELITVTTADGKELDGGLYRPPAGTDKKIGILIVHGLTWNFYRGPARWLPPLLAPHGYTCLALNMRDHDLDAPVDFELSHHDITAGLDRLRAEDVSEVVLLAHGYACNKAVSFVAQSGTSPIERYVLTTVGSIKGYRPDIWDDVLSKAPQMLGSALVVQGADDKLLEPQLRADELVAAATGCRVDVTLLPCGGHYFAATQQELADRILSWCGGQG